jgi:hypothetical protein
VGGNELVKLELKEILEGRESIPVSTGLARSIPRGKCHNSESSHLSPRSKFESERRIRPDSSSFGM